MKKIRIGAVNWDASLPPDTYFGFYQINSLSQSKYRGWTPYYAELLDGESITYRRRTPEEYECEMQYALDAGIDYFAYVWYPTEGSLAHEPISFRDCSHKVHELNYARGLYEKSRLKERLNMCAILAAHPFTDNDLARLVEAFSKPYYEKIEARPLLYVYNGYREDVIKKIHQMCRERKIPTPYTVPMVPKFEGQCFALADALSSYGVVNRVNIASHEELIGLAIEQSRGRMAPMLKLIPTFTTGWNPAPRVERPTPWMSKAEGVSSYREATCAPRASCEELLEGAVRFADFIRTEVREHFVGHILTFAWNEFEEGGYICPTYDKDGKIDRTRVDVFFKISAMFRKTLGEDC